MRKSLLLSVVLVAALVGPAAAQDNERGGVRTETMSRESEGVPKDLVWNLIGLLGLLGLLGLFREHADDSYHPASLE